MSLFSLTAKTSLCDKLTVFLLDRAREKTLLTLRSFFSGLSALLFFRSMQVGFSAYMINRYSRADLTYWHWEAADKHCKVVAEHTRSEWPSESQAWVGIAGQRLLPTTLGESWHVLRHRSIPIKWSQQQLLHRVVWRMPWDSPPEGLGTVPHAEWVVPQY